VNITVKTSKDTGFLPLFAPASVKLPTRRKARSTRIKVGDKCARGCDRSADGKELHVGKR